MKIIGITGKAGAGKDTTADMLLSLAGYEKASFSTPIKLLIGDWIGWDGKKDEKGRKLMQDVGMAGRAYNPLIWIHYVAGRIQCEPKDYAIPDVRFLNEAEWIRSKGGIIVRVIGRQSDLGALSSHESETEMDLIKADYVLNNQGSLDDLEMQVKELLQEVK